MSRATGGRAEKDTGTFRMLTGRASSSGGLSTSFEAVNGPSARGPDQSQETSAGAGERRVVGDHGDPGPAAGTALRPPAPLRVVPERPGQLCVASGGRGSHTPGRDRTWVGTEVLGRRDRHLGARGPASPASWSLTLGLGGVREELGPGPSPQARWGRGPAVRVRPCGVCGRVSLSHPCVSGGTSCHPGCTPGLPAPPADTGDGGRGCRERAGGWDVQVKFLTSGWATCRWLWGP